jgi:DNA-binding transcriptional MerR regulator
MHPTMPLTYSISDLAKEFDLTTRAMRFYEDMGLLQPERSGPGGRSRIYSGRDRTRLKLTLRAKRLGLSLTEAKEIIDMYATGKVFAGDCTTPKATGSPDERLASQSGRAQGASARSTCLAGQDS